MWAGRGGFSYLDEPQGIFVVWVNSKDGSRGLCNAVPSSASGRLFGFVEKPVNLTLHSFTDHGQWILEDSGSAWLSTATLIRLGPHDALMVFSRCALLDSTGTLYAWRSRES